MIRGSEWKRKVKSLAGSFAHSLTHKELLNRQDFVYNSSTDSLEVVLNCFVLVPKLAQLDPAGPLRESE